MKNLFKALADFQQEVPVIFKESTASTSKYSYKYADLPAIFTAINPLLKKHGLGFTQITEHKDGIDYLATVVFHVESGESMETKIRLIPEIELHGQNIFQSYGSQITYFRRYGISQILGLVTDIDNDAAGKQVIDNKRLQVAIEKIKAGEFTREQLEARFALTEPQKKFLEQNEI